MSSQTHKHLHLTKPFMIVSTDETVSDSIVAALPHRRQHSIMKRDVSKSLSQTRNYLGKRQKKSHPGPEISIECPDPSLAPRDYMTSSSWSNMDSPQAILPVPLPSPALDGPEHSLEHTQRPLQVAELVNRLNFRLKRIFGSRRGSAEDGELPLASSDLRRSRTSLNLRGLAEDAHLEGNPEYLMWNGSCQLPNVSEFFDANGEVGPSSFYYTADWNAFQKTFQTQGNSAVQTRLNHHIGSNGAMDLERFDLFRGQGTQGSEWEIRKRKDSLFSFSDFLRSRRLSKIDKGKGRMVVDDEAGLTQHEEAGLVPASKASPGVVISSCLADIGVLPRFSTESMPPLSPTAPQDVPQAEFSSLESSTPSWDLSASSTPPDSGTTARQMPRARQVAPHCIVPAADASAVRASPAPSVSSIHASAAAAPTNSKGDTALPISTPSYTRDASSSISPPSPAQHKDSYSSQADLTTPATPWILPTVISSPSSSPSISPLATMQSLSLGPPQHVCVATGSARGDGAAGTIQTSSSLGLEKRLDDDDDDNKCLWGEERASGMRRCR